MKVDVQTCVGYFVTDIIEYFDTPDLKRMMKAIKEEIERRANLEDFLLEYHDRYDDDLIIVKV